MEEIFDDCRDLVQSAVDGHNVTVMTYGQTGAGKTYTLFGNKSQEGLAQYMKLGKLGCNQWSIVGVTSFNDQKFSMLQNAFGSWPFVESGVGGGTSPIL